MLVWIYPLLWLAAITGGLMVFSFGEPWGWTLLGPAGAALLYIHVRGLIEEVSGWGRLRFATRERWIGIRAFLGGFSAAVCIWGGTLDSTVGKAMSIIGFLVISACVYAGAFAKR